MIRKRIKHMRLSKYQLHVVMDRVDRDIFELTVSDVVAPIKHSLVYASTKRDAIRQFQQYVHHNYPL